MTVWELLGLLGGLVVLSLVAGYGWQWILERRADLKDVLVAMKETEEALKTARVEVGVLAEEIRRLTA